MTDYVAGKTIVVTGAGSGFGRLVSQRAGKLGARLVCADVDGTTVTETADSILSAGGEAFSVTVDVADFRQMKGLAQSAVERFGSIDVMINNAGVMPLAMFADHETAVERWSRCIDINFKGVLYGIVCVYDQMMKQGAGQIINISSIYGNHPVLGAGVYGATKSAVNFLSESLRVESRGKIKVTSIKPTGVPGTKLGEGVVNREAIIGIVGQNAVEYIGLMRSMTEGKAERRLFDPDNMGYAVMAPDHIADQIIHVINQPDGVSIGDITIRASGEHFIL